MTKPHRHRLSIVALGIAAAGLLAAGVAVSRTDGQRTTTGPDVTVYDLLTPYNNGGDGTYHGYAIGTTSCNVGDTPVWWCDSTNGHCNDTQHPVILENLYRIKSGRFEQIGASWLKHGFLSTNSTSSSNGQCNPAHPTCVAPPFGGDQLGLGCTDTYGAGLNGSRPLGMRSEVDATTGEFPFPYTTQSFTGEDELIRVLDTDLDPTQNVGAVYYAEGQYVTADDAHAGNGLNNATYRPVAVGGAPNFDLSFSGQPHGTREKSAIQVWPTLDPAVGLANGDIPLSSPVERFEVARRVTLENGKLHYEYAIHNYNSDRAGQSFTVLFPVTTAITNVGFHDLDMGPGEIWDTTDWTIDTSVANQVSWSTQTFGTNPHANALHWGLTFSFWFDADREPTGLVQTIGLFKPGSPASFTVAIDGPMLFADGFESNDTSHWSSTQP